MLDLLKTFIIIPIFPLYLIIESINPFKYLKAKRQQKLNFSFILGNIGKLLLALLLLLPLWIGIYTALGVTIAVRLKLLEEFIPISGTGSMYPTFPKGESKDPQEQAKELVAYQGMLPYPNGLLIFPQFSGSVKGTPLENIVGKNIFGHEIGFGDIVVFENEAAHKLTERIAGTRTGMVKRVIGLPDDTIELKDGLVYRNGKPLLEAYTARARSTFGGEFLPDCTPFKIPPGKLFVMGDNRKGSSDSRSDLGLIDYNDIDHVLPFDKQDTDLRKNWRNPKNDLSESAKIKLNKTDYLNLVNSERIKLGLKPLTYNPKLEISANKRGQYILRNPKSPNTYPLKQAMSESGYSNIVTGETSVSGYYEAEELFEGMFEYSDLKQILLDKELEEIGISESESEIDGCTKQVIIQHLGGYIPPNYTIEVINSFKDALNKLNEVKPGWEELKNYDDFYSQNKADVDRIIEIINLRIFRLQQVVKRMEQNQYLSAEEQRFIEDDYKLGEEQNKLADRLNKAT